MKRYLKIGIITVVLLVMAASMMFLPSIKNVEVESGNPASKYCLEHGGSSLIQENTAADGTTTSKGICEFPDGSQCEEWQYFRGECVPR